LLQNHAQFRSGTFETTQSFQLGAGEFD
jgi:hypothetical protein